MNKINIVKKTNKEFVKEINQLNGMEKLIENLEQKGKKIS